MKIVYLYNYNPNLPGVNNKVVAKIKWLQNSGLNISMLCQTHLSNCPEFDDLEVTYHKPAQKVNLPKIFNLKYLNFINQFISNYRSAQNLKMVLKTLNADLIVMRYGTSNYFFNKLVAFFKYKFVFEHNTHELEQLKLRYKGFFKSHSWISFEYWSEKYFGPKTLANAAGLIGVTHEITNYEVRRFSKKNVLPLSTTISNGINVSNYPINYPSANCEGINLVMILGVTAQWHGLERIINGLNDYKGSRKVTLYIIGKVKEIECPHVVHMGYMNLNEMNDFFSKTPIHIGVASLALHKINIKEASVLKAREYLARGIPFIYGYIDTDLEQDDFIKSLVLKVDANDSDVYISEVIKFYDRVSKISNYPLLIRDFAVKKVDMSIKMNLYKDFLCDIIDTRAQA